MPHEFEVRVDASMMKAAWNAWFFKGGWLWKFLAAAAVLSVIIGFDLRAGNLGAFSIFALAVLGLAIVIFIAVYIVGLRRSLAKLHSIQDGCAAYCLTHETIEARSSLGSVAVSWAAVAELRRYDNLILLGFKGAMYSVIPISQIPEAGLAFMIERCRSAGARIIDL